jgi:hypothetical protein
MKFQDWKDVKVHDLVIYPSEDYGVLQAEIIEVDVKIVENLPTFHYEYPFGLTKDKGTVRIKYTLNLITREIIESLANLVAYTPRNFQELLKAYNDWQTYFVSANSYKEVFNTLIQNRVAE